MPVGLLRALTPVGALVGKVMGQPPNLRELISSADGVTFWATPREGVAGAWLRSPAASTKAFVRYLEAEGKLPAADAAA